MTLADLANLATIAIGLGSVLVGFAAMTVAKRQTDNAVRPVIVVLEKFTDNKNPAGGRSLYLVNMGQAVAINIEIVHSNISAVVPTDSHEEAPRTEIAVGRRGVLAGGYADPVWTDLELEVRYTDINGVTYRTSFGGGKHSFPPRETATSFLS